MRETQIRSKETFAGQVKIILTEVLQNNLDSSLEIRRLTPDSDESLISKFRVGFRIFQVCLELKTNRFFFFFNN